MKIPLAVPDYGPEEILECMDSLLRKQVTMGKKVRRFEALWAEKVGRRYAIAVNSGSSANLLAVAALARHLPRGIEVVVPATTWSTTVAPFVQYGFKLVFADIDESLCLNPKSVEEAISPQTKAIAIVPLLGFAYDPYLLTVAERHNLLVLTDCCEGHGAKIGHLDVGGFGDLATWSFFLSHIIQTIEGGIVCTNDHDTADFLRATRAHGWVREMDSRDSVAAVHPDIDPRFLFVELGYNVRPTELTAAFGIHQIGKLDSRVEHRRKVVDIWATYLEEYKEWFMPIVERQGAHNAYFGFPVIIRPGAPFARREMTSFLHENDIDTRPIMAHLQRHPVFRTSDYRSVSTPYADMVHENGFFVGLHSGIGQEEQQYFMETMTLFLRRL